VGFCTGLALTIPIPNPNPDPEPNPNPNPDPGLFALTQHLWWCCCCLFCLLPLICLPLLFAIEVRLCLPGENARS